MKRILLACLFLLCVSTAAHAQAFDPCASLTTNKWTFNFNITSATTTELIAAVANKNIYLCGIYVQNTGASPTWQLKVGTKVTNPCDTSGATVTPAFTSTTPSGFGFGSAMLLNTGNTASGSGVSSSELCLVSGGTITSINGYGTFVQQ